MTLKSWNPFLFKYWTLVKTVKLFNNYNFLFLCKFFRISKCYFKCKFFRIRFATTCRFTVVSFECRTKVQESRAGGCSTRKPPNNLQTVRSILWTMITIKTKSIRLIIVPYRIQKTLENNINLLMKTSGRKLLT